MTSDQCIKLGLDLCARWPGRFDDADLAVWYERFDAYAPVAIHAAIAEFANTSTFVPKVHEIEKLIKARQPKPPSPAADIARRYRTVDAQQIVRAQPELDGQLEAELLFRKCRAQFKRRIHLCTEVSRLQQRELKPHEVRRVEAYREMSERECRTDLVAAGVPAKQADVIAACVIGTDGDCQGAIDQIRALFDPDSQITFQGASS